MYSTKYGLCNHVFCYKKKLQFLAPRSRSVLNTDTHKTGVKTLGRLMGCSVFTEQEYYVILGEVCLFLSHGYAIAPKRKVTYTVILEMKMLLRNKESFYGCCVLGVGGGASRKNQQKHSRNHYFPFSQEVNFFQRINLKFIVCARKH